MELIDSHCHLERFYRQGELDAVLARAAEAGVGRLIAIGTGKDDWPLYQQLAAEHPGRIYWAAGLHPSDVGADWEEQVEMLPQYWKNGPRPVAVGEIGLDRFRLPGNAEEAAAVMVWQDKAFRRQLQLAKELDMPVVVHSRHAFEASLAVIDECGFPWERVVFHCFVDGAGPMRMLNERGGRGSFTGIVTYKNAPEVREACRGQGLDRLMVETDAPYLAPVPHRGKPCEPFMVRDTAAFIAGELGVSPEELAAIATANTEAFFNL
ncbi:TatD family hydrolase [Ruficoccus amylovorans]|uniref:TatD family hydrolase n=1 Tax=Ruficoccus amylovorans TaxID=1804625 RepID=A0A842HD28_9BACT|nr:TatD family hydrolase [Ruficoccus amylovorans]MBC2593281.1 TatD family hydrolase [Ruficoccus amylovorans]